MKQLAKIFLSVAIFCLAATSSQAQEKKSFQIDQKEYETQYYTLMNFVKKILPSKMYDIKVLVCPAASGGALVVGMTLGGCWSSGTNDLHTIFGGNGGIVIGTAVRMTVFLVLGDTTNNISGTYYGAQAELAQGPFGGNVLIYRRPGGTWLLGLGWSGIAKVDLSAGFLQVN